MALPIPGRTSVPCDEDRAKPSDGYRPAVLARVVQFQATGLIVKRVLGGTFTIAYGEILTAERLRAFGGIRLHTRTSDPVRLMLRGDGLMATEALLRSRGVRVVDCWGAIIAPTLADFESELSRGPAGMRQSSDNA
jgi:hypothetical protein